MSGNLYPSFGLSGATKYRGISGTTKGGKNCLDVNVLSNVGSTGGFIYFTELIHFEHSFSYLVMPQYLGVKVTIKAKKRQYQSDLYWL